MIRLALADDHSIVRAGLEQLMSTAADIELIGMATSGAEAYELVARELPDVILMDLSMPDGDGVSATRRISADFPQCKVLVLTSFSDQNRITDALAAGAEGYLLKHSEPDRILDAVRAIHEGGSPLDPKAARVLLDTRRIRSAAETLSPREMELLLLVRDGLANKQIARRLGISEHTVKAHLTRIFQRLGVSDRTQAAVWASRHLTPPADNGS